MTQQLHILVYVQIKFTAQTWTCFYTLVIIVELFTPRDRGDTQMDRQNVIHLYDSVLFSSTKGKGILTHENKNELQGHYSKLKKETSPMRTNTGVFFIGNTKSSQMCRERG